MIVSQCVTYDHILTVDQITVPLFPPQECSQRRLNLEEQVKTLRREIAEEEKQTKKINRDMQVKLSDVNTCENDDTIENESFTHIWRWQ